MDTLCSLRFFIWERSARRSARPGDGHQLQQDAQPWPPSAPELQRKFCAFQHQAQREPVEIPRDGRRQFVLMSAEHYDRLRAAAQRARPKPWTSCSPPWSVRRWTGAPAGRPAEVGRIKFFELAANPRRGKDAPPISPLALEAVKRIDAAFDPSASSAPPTAPMPAHASPSGRRRRRRSSPNCTKWMRAERERLSRHAPVAKAMNYMLSPGRASPVSWRTGASA
jgi:hypothetical protein